MIVADTNLIAYLIIQGQQTATARAVLQKDSAWAAPRLWRSEFRNILALYIRQQHLALADAIQLMSSAETVLRSREYEVESDPVLRLAAASNCTAYDCEFVHLAQELGVSLVTSDQKVLRLFPAVAISPEDFTK